jgi:hypothetical protein
MTSDPTTSHSCDRQFYVRSSIAHSYHTRLFDIILRASANLTTASIYPALSHQLYSIIIAALFAHTRNTHLHGTRLHRLQAWATSILP